MDVVKLFLVSAETNFLSFSETICKIHLKITTEIESLFGKVTDPVCFRKLFWFGGFVEQFQNCTLIYFWISHVFGPVATIFTKIIAPIRLDFTEHNVLRKLVCSMNFWDIFPQLESYHPSGD